MTISLLFASFNVLVAFPLIALLSYQVTIHVIIVPH